LDRPEEDSGGLIAINHCRNSGAALKRRGGRFRTSRTWADAVASSSREAGDRLTDPCGRFRTLKHSTSSALSGGLPIQPAAVRCWGNLPNCPSNDVSWRQMQERLGDRKSRRLPTATVSQRIGLSISQIVDQLVRLGAAHVELINDSFVRPTLRDQVEQILRKGHVIDI